MTNSLATAVALLVFGGAGLAASLMQTGTVPAAERHAFALAMTVGQGTDAGSNLSCRNQVSVSTVAVGRDCRVRRNGTVALAD